MFLPLHDQNPIRHVDVPYVTYGLIAANVLVFLFQLSHQPASAFNEFAITFSAISPAAWTGTPIDRLPGLPDELTLVTYAFFHADWMHLLSNMLFLWVFGDNVEDAVGHWRFLLFYFLCAIGGGLDANAGNRSLAAAGSPPPAVLVSGLGDALGLFRSGGRSNCTSCRRTTEIQTFRTHQFLIHVVHVCISLLVVRN